MRCGEVAWGRRRVAGQVMKRQEAQLGGALQRHLLALLAGDVDSDALDTGPALLQKAGCLPGPLPC